MLPAGVRLGVLALSALLAACSRRHDPPRVMTTAAAAPDPVIGQLEPFEDETRRAFDLAHPPSAETGLGANPWNLVRVPAGYIGILRGRSAVVLLDESLHERARLPAPRSPTGLALAPNGDLYVTGELSPKIAKYTLHAGHLAANGEIVVPGVFGCRDIAITPEGALWVTDERAGELLRVAAASGAVVERHAIGHGPARVVATPKHVVASAVLEHTITVFPDNTKITNDGPFWGFAALETSRGLLIVSGGVENHPLDRTNGYFGFIDSFVYVDRLENGGVTRLAAVNVSEQGVVTPKALSLASLPDGTITVLVTGYASSSGARISIDPAGAVTAAAPVPLVPGVRALTTTDDSGRLALADPLLDAWILLDASGPHVVPVPDEVPRDPRSRIGEALFFTTLMSPENTSADAHSRFTCETCHFEGYTDGRTHSTGRGDVHATTKPLIGLAGNRPYFTRGLDKNLSTVSHSEFRVAAAGNATNPYFDIAPEDAPWLGAHERIAALDLRRDLLTYLMVASHLPNPAVVGRSSYSPEERQGAELFRDRCSSCHSARLDVSEPATEQPFATWESQIFSDTSSIVWASTGYHKTGITPYVHDDGARTTSLRRLYKKYPYFTNGSATSIPDLLSRVRITPTGEVLHDSSDQAAQPLSAAQASSLAAFLGLL